MNIVRVAEAIRQFRDLAMAAGFEVLHESFPLGSVTYCAEAEALLRLVWDGKDEYLYLQVSHGVLKAPPSGWLDLFSSKCIGGAFRDPELPEVRFLASVGYGLDLMLPGAAR
ncbi:hypothetical protein [Pseudomonas flexibilis]|uniref:hypothetical protein n=1 Tax=Pseudomonas flexibilis TaxID=706570 RepID=UPI0011158835|nr:hypothetical protein [Pseudomonas flexibilis]